MSENKAKLLVVTGPSGAGLREIVGAVLESRTDIGEVIPLTARRMKEGEVNGVGYFFYELEDWNAMKASGDLIETTEFAGNDYGTSRRLVEEQFAKGNHVLAERELGRAAQIKRAMSAALCVYVEPSQDVLEERLRALSKSEREFSLRLQTAEKMRAEADFCDLRVNSDDTDAAAREIESQVD